MAAAKTAERATANAVEVGSCLRGDLVCIPVDLALGYSCNWLLRGVLQSSCNLSPVQCESLSEASAAANPLTTVAPTATELCGGTTPEVKNPLEAIAAADEAVKAAAKTLENAEVMAAAEHDAFDAAVHGNMTEAARHLRIAEKRAAEGEKAAAAAFKNLQADDHADKVVAAEYKACPDLWSCLDSTVHVLQSRCLDVALSLDVLTVTAHRLSCGHRTNSAWRPSRIASQSPVVLRGGLCCH